MTSSDRHGLTIGIERAGDQSFIAIKAVGRLSHGDYETMTPMLDAALEAVPRPSVKVLFDATEMAGWEPRAAWDDLKLGLKHGTKFEKIAIYGNRGWQQAAAKLGSWFISGEARYFDTREEALAWLAQ